MVDCQVAGSLAVFFQSREGARVNDPAATGGQPVYRTFLLHNQFVYVVTLKGSGGFDLRAITATKRLLGSWTWAS